VRLPPTPRPAATAAALSLALLGGCLGAGEEPARTVAAPLDIPEAPTAALPSAAPTETETASLTPDYPEIESLKGLSAAGVQDLLGSPQFRRRDKPAELWQYRGKRCVLDLFLYPGGGAALAVDYLDVRGEAASHQDCFVSLLEARRRAERG